MMRRLSSGAVLLTLSSCLIAAGASEGMARFIEQNVGLKDSLSLAQLRARVKSRQEKSRQLDNLQVPGQKDRIVVLGDGKGLEVQAYVTGPGRVLIQRVTVTTPQFKLPSGLQINVSSIDDVHKAFGESGETEKGPAGALAQRFYDPHPNGFEVSALLWFDRDRHLMGVEWRYEID
jgi:hypothetical protein